MKTKLEQIDLLRKRANVSYKEAKEALEKNNDDIVEALVYLEEGKKMKEESSESRKSKEGDSLGKKINKFVKKCNKTKIIVSKGENTVLNVSSTVVIIAGVFTLPVSLAVAALPFLTGHKITIKKPSGDEANINRVLGKATSAFNKAKEELFDNNEEQGKNETEEKK
ncbi:MAG: ubiquitin [Alkaliphilus sp.]|nr:DUF4342 domain-containing protein [bacterium AH-315-E09]PHS36400.1 MAG: ubiquitin [Alkaliphilus sp.]